MAHGITSLTKRWVGRDIVASVAFHPARIFSGLLVTPNKQLFIFRSGLGCTRISIQAKKTRLDILRHQVPRLEIRLGKNVLCGSDMKMTSGRRMFHVERETEELSVREGGRVTDEPK